MRFDRKNFNSRRFLTILGLFGAVAALMLFTKPKNPLDRATNKFPHYSLQMTSSHAKGSIILNGISIGHHQARDQTVSTIGLTPWLKNGSNTLYITTSKPSADHRPDLKVVMEFTPPKGAVETHELLHLKQSSSEKVVIEATGLPVWQWIQGEATFHDSAEVQRAVEKLHHAFETKDIATIRAMERPMFHDMELITGREGLERRVYRGEIINKGVVEPLGKFTIVPFDNGRIMRVSNRDGEAPIRVYYRYGNGGKLILTGQFWSKIDGQWYVVR